MVIRLRSCPGLGWCVPLNSPLHGGVGDDKRRGEVEDLVAKAPPDIEDGCVCGSGERALSVSAECVGYNTPLCLRTCSFPISPRPSNSLGSTPSIHNAKSILPKHLLPAMSNASCRWLDLALRIRDGRNSCQRASITYLGYPMIPGICRNQSLASATSFAS